MSTIKDITIRVNKKHTTVTVILYGSKDDNEYSIPFECNKGTPLDSEEREFIREAIELKIRKLRIEDHVDEYSDDAEDLDSYVENHY